MERPVLLGEEVLLEKYGKQAIMRKYDLGEGQVEDFFVFGGKVSAIIFPLTENQEVIAVRQFRYGADEFILELPGGCLDGKSLEQTVEEELLEEVGYEPREILYLGSSMFFDPAFFTVDFIPVLAWGCKKVESGHAREPTEIMETALVPLPDWLEMIKSGKIRDSKTLAVTFRALFHLGWTFSPKT
ncbi:MAG: NUDIX hydrolase [Candidatus Staskawiczbacteria bacterium]|nr:NUDIX hydrolase [Candidatus Staskawiczbacteria bacterium]